MLRLERLEARETPSTVTREVVTIPIGPEPYAVVMWVHSDSPKTDNTVALPVAAPFDFVQVTV